MLLIYFIILINVSMITFAKNFRLFIALSICFVANVWTMDDLIFRGLPIIQINTENQAPILDKINYVPMRFILTDHNNPNNNISLTAEDFSEGGIRGRGNASWRDTLALKKSYRIKFNKKQSLLGLEKAKSWVLIAQFRDPTLLFNAIAFEYGNRFELPFNHSFNFVELYLNGQYMGNYLLTEQNQVNPGRVDINKSKGWFVAIDTGYDEEDPKFITTNGMSIVIHSPEFEPANISNPAFNFVQKDINELCDSMFSPNFPENGYRDMININTFVDFIMIQDITDNGDFQWLLNTYLYKDNGNEREELNLINMGPLWDFDAGYGFDYKFDFFNNPNKVYNKNPFIGRFFEDPIFLAKYKERWNEKYLDIISINSFIDAIANKIGVSAIENFNTWWYKTISLWFLRNHVQQENDFWQEIENLKNYLALHIAYLNEELNKVEVLPKTKTFANQPFGYSEIMPQTFTLVAYGDITELSATLQNANLSDFEIIAQPSKRATGNGGYLATVSVKPKSLLPIGIHSDNLILRAKNQGTEFSFEVPLSFYVEDINVAVANRHPLQIATSNIRAKAISNAIMLENLPKNAKVEIYNLQGKHIYSTNSENNQILKIPVQTKGMYIVKCYLPITPTTASSVRISLIKVAVP